MGFRRFFRPAARHELAPDEGPGALEFPEIPLGFAQDIGTGALMAVRMDELRADPEGVMRSEYRCLARGAVADPPGLRRSPVRPTLK